MTADAVSGHTADMDEPGQIDQVIAGNVRATRARLRMTQEDLADAMDWSRRTVTSLETGTRRVTVADLIGLCKALGVDMSERAINICRQRGFEAHAVKFEDFTPPRGMRFNFIHSSHLIEHVASPVAYLQKVYDLLEPGGVTVFITPNTSTWESRVFRRHCGGLHVPRHWVLFNGPSAVRAARRVGFEHLETSFSTNSQFWIWSLHSLLGTSLPARLTDWLFPSDHRFVKSSVWTVLRGGFFTAVDMFNVVVTGRSSNMAVILRKPMV